MLASTVQFSSNDQPPITPTPEGLKFTGAGVPKTDLAAVPSGPNNVPARIPGTREPCSTHPKVQY